MKAVVVKFPKIHGMNNIYGMKVDIDSGDLVDALMNAITIHYNTETCYQDVVNMLVSGEMTVEVSDICCVCNEAVSAHTIFGVVPKVTNGQSPEFVWHKLVGQGEKPTTVFNI